MGRVSLQNRDILNIYETIADYLPSSETIRAHGVSQNSKLPLSGPVANLVILRCEGSMFLSIAQALTFMMSGMPMFGADTCGFSGNTDFVGNLNPYPAATTNFTIGSLLAVDVPLSFLPFLPQS